MMIFNKNNIEGQSLVEVVVACGILGIIMAAMMSIVIATRNLTYQSVDQSKATVLAQEGIEIVKHQRDIGCGFDNIKGDVEESVSDFVIRGDTIGGSSEDIIQGSISQTNAIDNFLDFRRIIKIYNLNAVSGSDLTDVNSSNFPNCATASYDCTDRYYLVKVEVQKAGGTNLSTAKTIITK